MKISIPPMMVPRGYCSRGGDHLTSFAMVDHVSGQVRRVLDECWSLLKFEGLVVAIGCFSGIRLLGSHT
jgi:hypothetical protein